MNLRDYVLRLPDPDQRARALEALHDAEMVPLSPEVLDDIEARYGRGAGAVDLTAWMADQFRQHPEDGEFESLMRAAWMLRVRLAFTEIEGKDGPVLVRTDKLQ